MNRLWHPIKLLSATRFESMRRLSGINVDSLKSSLRQRQEQTLEEVLTTFTAQMPEAYFSHVDPELQASHLGALVALQSSDAIPSLAIMSNTSNTMSFIRPGNRPGLLSEMLKELPRDRILNAVKVFTTRDQRLALNIFHFNGHAHAVLPQGEYQASAILALADQIESGAKAPDHALLQPCPELQPSALGDFFKRCDPAFVANTSDRTFLLKKRLYDQVVDTEDCIATTEPWLDTKQQTTNMFTALTMAASDVVADDLLERVVLYLGNLPHNRGGDVVNPIKLDIHRLHLDLIDGTCPTSPRVALLRVLVQPWVGQTPDRTVVSAPSPRWNLIARDLQRLKWVSERALNLTTSQPAIPLLVAEVMDGLATMVHGILAHQSPFGFSRDRVWGLVTSQQNSPLAQKIAGLLLARFDPESPLPAELFDTQADWLAKTIAQDADNSDAVLALTTMLRAVRAVLRTNAHLKRRYSLAFRLDPELFAREDRDQTPYGVIFVTGDAMSGFHVRFRSIARGGLRVVTPSSRDSLAVEAARTYEEAYGLAYAQQLKNKDIPEGGSKGVLLIHQVDFKTPESRSAVLRKAVKAFADGVLDLTSEEPDVVARRLDLLEDSSGSEQIYLGPDEQVLPEDIDWIVARAKQRNHPTPAVFMSSKPEAGINHKQYGVTSEGVQVFLDHALAAQGFKDKAFFTVKMTGGPDGDVAGNMIKILRREYGDAVRLVGIADGSGVAEDPSGLNMDELVRLSEHDLPITAFDAGCLSNEGTVTSADTVAGAKLRNTMHMRVVSDAFVPAGGRPNTINLHNWEQYLQPDGSPSSPIIAEGANLFITPEARIKLSEAGCTVIKDSSCNKAGVICSSYEILAGMLLSQEEFLANKTEYVAQVIDLLRSHATQEARLLMDTLAQDPSVPLPLHCIRLSQLFNAVKDSTVTQLKQLTADEYQELLRSQLPPLLQSWPDVDVRLRQVPAPYQDRMVATALASQLVYNCPLSVLELLLAQGQADASIRFHRATMAANTLKHALPDNGQGLLHLLEALPAGVLLSRH
eukprot:TRINITY_DN11843_c0_g1_i2.p1 TRINITY_DN11843_c0_g1~~TRINITY_DN11843_c0_g1_i2.p1  ORF type:complete len:1038 (+),score=260.19 TRINITY_DN11843_c0_g1_i2:394-3507(+)